METRMMTSTRLEDDLGKNMEDDLKKIKMEDDLKTKPKCLRLTRVS
jgi:hypothetical protein